MRDILEPTAAWFDAGRPFALATVVRTWRSAPRQPGASMAVSDEGEALGSVSGGCVEGDVYDVAQKVLATGVPQLQTYGVTDDDAFAVGLTCGGTLDVFVERVDAVTHPAFDRVRAAAADRAPVAVATVVEHPDPFVLGRHLVVEGALRHGSLGDAGLDHGVAGAARGLLEHGAAATVHLGTSGQQLDADVAVFVESFAPTPTMYVFGAVDFAAALVAAAKLLGYYVVVCDARSVFATRPRFPDADEVVVAWPHVYLAAADVDERAVVCVLTHDPKFDIPLLDVALRGPAGYVGAMGSRATHADRMKRLREAGVPESALARLSSPIGLDLGARTPEETAVSIVAEVIAATWGGTGRRLRELDAPIHR